MLKAARSWSGLLCLLGWKLPSLPGSKLLCLLDWKLPCLLGWKLLCLLASLK